MRELNEECGDRILLGAGTVTTTDQVEKAAANGATFLVSPGCNPKLIPLMQRTGLAVLPGMLTPSEVRTTLRLELEAIKLFPGSSGGPSYLKSLRDTFPAVSFLPTGGVSVENIQDWFSADAFAVGGGGTLAPAALEEERECERVVVRARRLVDAVDSAGGGTRQI